MPSKFTHVHVLYLFPAYCHKVRKWGKENMGIKSAKPLVSVKAKAGRSSFQGVVPSACHGTTVQLTFRAAYFEEPGAEPIGYLRRHPWTSGYKAGPGSAPGCNAGKDFEGEKKGLKCFAKPGSSNLVCAAPLVVEICLYSWTGDDVWPARAQDPACKVMSRGMSR